MKKIIGLLTAISLVVTMSMQTAFAADLRTGDKATIDRISNNQWFISTVTWQPIETNKYALRGGEGTQFVYCLEHGSNYAPSNASMSIYDAYTWEKLPSGEETMLFNNTTGQPVANSNNTVMLKNGAPMSQNMVLALDSLIQNIDKVASGSSDQKMYLAQNAVRAFMYDTTGIGWSGGTISYAGGLYYDASGLACAGTVKVKNIADNKMLIDSVALYNIAMTALSSGKKQTDAYLRLVKEGEDPGDPTRFTYKVESSDKWQVAPECLLLAQELGVSVSPKSGNSGQAITVTVPKAAEESFKLKLQTLKQKGSGDLFFAVPANGSYQTMIGVNTPEKPDIGVEQSFKVSDEPDDVPVPEIPNIIVRGVKRDKEPGFDNNTGSGRGDGKLNAGFQVYVDGIMKSVFFAGADGQNGQSAPIEIWSFADLNKDITVHSASGYANRVTYTASATIKVDELTPEGYLSEALSGTGNGSRTYTVTYWAQSSRPIERFSNDDGDVWYVPGPWSLFQYRITPDPSNNTNTSDRIQSPVTFTNLIQKGHLHLNKVIEKDFDPWGEVSATKTPMEGAKFTIKLVNGGSESHEHLRAVKINPGEAGYDPWASCYRITPDSGGTRMDGRSGDNSFFVTSNYGQIKIFDIPYGNYQLDEVSAPSAGYVLEHSNFRITYDGQLASKDVTNYVIKDEIVIHKVDSETGKRIPSDKTAFRIRYMGNPNTPIADRPKDPNYGKYIQYPLGPSGVYGYTYHTDKNGKAVLYSPLSYGVYQLEEIVAPDGYYLGEASEADMANLPYVIHKFTVDKPGDAPFNHPVVVIELNNDSVKGKIEITKTGETIVGFKEVKTEYGILNVPVIEARPKDNVTFDIYAKSDVKLPDGIDAPLFVDKNGNAITLETVVENHALWKNAVRTEETVMPDGTELSVTTQRYPDDLNAMATANLLTATKKPNAYTIDYVSEDGDFIDIYHYEIQMEYSPDGYAYAEVVCTKKTEFKDGTLYDLTWFPSTTLFEVETGADTINDAGRYHDQVFYNGNEAAIDYLRALDFVKSNESLTIPVLRDFNIKYDGSGMAYKAFHTYTNPAKSEFYSAMWADEAHSGQVWVKHSANDLNYSKYFLAADFNEIKPVEHSYVLYGSELSERLYETCEIIDEESGEVTGTATTYFRPDDYFIVESLLPKFVYADDETAPENYLVAVEVNGDIELVKTNFEYRAWINLPDETLYPELSGYSLLYGKMLSENRMMYINDSDPANPLYLIFMENDGVDMLVPCSAFGEFFDTRLEGYRTAIYKIPQSLDMVLFTHDGLKIELDTADAMGLMRITKPDGTLESVIMHKTEPSVYMQLNDGTLVGVVYSGGYAFTQIDVPLGNEYPMLMYQGETTPIDRTESGVILDPTNSFLYVIPQGAAGDRITAELISPIGVPERTIFTIVTKQTDKNAIVLEFSDGRKMNVSTVKAVDGATRGHVEVSCFTPTYRYLLGEHVETVTTGKDGYGAIGEGKAVTSSLPLGAYIVRERGSSDSVVVEDGDYEVGLTYDGNYVPLIWGSAAAQNKMAAMQLNLMKVFQAGQNSANYTPKAGAVFGVYTNDDAGLPKGSLIGILTTDKNGIAQDVFKAPFGEYYVKELKTLPGYDLNPYIYPFSYDEGTVMEPLKTEFTEKGITVEYRYKDDYLTEVVVKTLKRIPSISYSVNGVSIDTLQVGVKAAGGAGVFSELTSIDHIATIKSPAKAEVLIDFGDGDTVQLTPLAKGFDVALTYAGTAAESIEYRLGLSGIKYRASVDSKYDDGAPKPIMVVDSTIKIFRELNIAAGTDRLVIEENDEKRFTDINTLPAADTIVFESGSTVNINCTDGVLSLDGALAVAEIFIDGKVLERDGIQADGSYAVCSPAGIVYFNKNVTINDIVNSNSFVQAIIGATYAEGEMVFNSTPLSVYKDGAAVSPDRSIMLDKLIPYTVVMSDGVTKADIILLHDNTLKLNLESKSSSNFTLYEIPKLESQGSGEFVTDGQGGLIEQGAAKQIKTIDGIVYFVTESRTYLRADAYAPVTVIDINTADGVLAGILNNLKPDRPMNPGTPEGPERPEIPGRDDREERSTELPDDRIPLIDREADGPDDASIFDEGIPLEGVDIPQTDMEDNFMYSIMLLIAALLLAVSVKLKKISHLN